jgi:tripartite-type tricarboxylate transporter receptor subunit TctC
LGWLAPANTPLAILDRRNAEKPAHAGRERKCVAAGTEPALLATVELVAFVKSEVQKWARLVVAAGLTVHS